MKKRADSAAETRARIIEAAMALHEQVGPRDTTISAIAEHAGVQRLTVYRHFPDERKLFEACTGRWLELNPPPNPVGRAAKDGFARAEAKLAALYAYYRGTERMWAASFRDEADVPALRKPMRQFRSYLESIRDELITALAPRGNTSAMVAATLGHLLRFSTWQSLKEEGLSDARILALAMDWLRTVAREQT